MCQRYVYAALHYQYTATLSIALVREYRGGSRVGVQGVRTPAPLITVPFFEKNIFSIYMLFLAEQGASLFVKMAVLLICCLSYIF